MFPATHGGSRLYNGANRSPWLNGHSTERFVSIAPGCGKKNVSGWRREGVSGQYHPSPAAQIRIPRAETRKKAEYRRPKPRSGISDFGFRPSFGPRISGFGFGPLRSRVGGTVQIRPRRACGALIEPFSGFRAFSMATQGRTEGECRMQNAEGRRRRRDGSTLGWIMRSFQDYGWCNPELSDSIPQGLHKERGSES